MATMILTCVTSIITFNPYTTTYIILSLHARKIKVKDSNYYAPCHLYHRSNILMKPLLSFCAIGQVKWWGNVFISGRWKLLLRCIYSKGSTSRLGREQGRWQCVWNWDLQMSECPSIAPSNSMGNERGNEWDRSLIKSPLHQWCGG